MSVCKQRNAAMVGMVLREKGKKKREKEEKIGEAKWGTCSVVAPVRLI